MAKRLRWTSNALRQNQKICDYWEERNKSKVYSRKLDAKFDETAEYLTENWNWALGKKTAIEMCGFIGWKITG